MLNLYSQKAQLSGILEIQRISESQRNEVSLKISEKHRFSQDYAKIIRVKQNSQVRRPRIHLGSHSRNCAILKASIGLGEHELNISLALDAYTLLPYLVVFQRRLPLFESGLGLRCPQPFFSFLFAYPP